MGTIVVTTAANRLTRQTGQPVAELMLLDAPKGKFEVIYSQLFNPGAARRVRNFWAGGHTGLGAPMNIPGIEDIQAPERDAHGSNTGIARIDHIDILLWFYENYL